MIFDGIGNLFASELSLSSSFAIEHGPSLSTKPDALTTE